MRARSRNRRWLAAALLAGVSWIAGAALGRTPLGRALDARVYDAVATSHPPAPPPHILLVLVDDESRRRIREPLAFWQKHYARVIRAAADAGSRAIALDVIFALDEDFAPPGAYQDLSQAILQANGRGVPVILGYDRSADLPSPRMYLLARSTGSLGYLNLVADPDETVRRYSLCDRVDGEDRFSLGMMAGKSADARCQSGDGSLLIFRGPPRSFPSVSFARVLEMLDSGDQAGLKRLFGGVTVFVGSDDSQDLHATPFHAAGRHPGVEIHATAAAMVEQDLSVHVWPREWVQLFAASLVFLSVLVFLRAPWHWGAVLFVLLLATPVVSSFTVWQRFIWLRPAPAMLGVLVGYIAVNAYRYQTEFKERSRLRRHFAQYVSEDVVREIVERGGVALEGRQQRVTVLFSDIRGFTTLSEGSEPVALVRQLNEYLSAMTDVITQHGGMVDKFIGDGILALFGAPLEDDRSAERAARAALGMLARLEPLNQAWAAQGKPRLQIGIGIHSGEAIVGNVGSDKKLEYTAIGDTVNTASRVEARTKESVERCGVAVLISEDTLNELRRLGCSLEAEFMSEDTLKGKSQATRLYLLRGMKDQAGGVA